MSYCMAVSPTLAITHSLPYTNPLHTVGLGSVVESGTGRLKSRVRFPSGSFFPRRIRPVYTVLISFYNSTGSNQLSAGHFCPQLRLVSTLTRDLLETGSRVDSTTLPQSSGLPSLSENSFNGSLFVAFTTWGQPVVTLFSHGPL